MAPAKVIAIDAPLAHKAGPGSYRWWLIAMLWCVCFCNYADRQAISSIFPLLRSDLSLSDLQLGIIASSFMWMYAVAGPVAGWLSDRVSPRSVILGALIFWSAVTAGTAVSHSFGTMVFFRTLGGLGEAFYFPAAMALIGLYHSTATRSRAMALHQSSVYAGTIGGGALSAVIAQSHGWRTSFVVFGVAGVLLGVVLLLFLRRPPARALKTETTTDQNFFHGVRDALRSGRVIALIVVFIGANFVAVVFLTWLPTYLYTKFHLSLAHAGFSSTAYLQIASVLGVLLGGVLADKFAMRRVGGRQMIQAFGLLMGVPFIFLTGWSLTMAGLIAGMIGFGFFKGMYDANIWASLYDVIPVERRGVAAGTMNSLGWLGGGFAPILIATAAGRFGMSACLSATSAIYLCLGLVLLLLVRNMRRSEDVLPA
ncbi:MFS transporter [Terriglobus roseus]|uniref:Sugar phosphate permease n=1 Tax=Terriglobus roseus TaxID=392734 RepID=A0A1H4M5Y6_9BACT|nr:MFS transporter [Terriglobus roseus]SEB78217.1 Sugar phosphate permease [Terriglobus roseus]